VHHRPIRPTGKTQLPQHRRPSYPNIGDKVADILTVVEPEIGLFLPGDMAGLVDALRGYRIDVVVVCGLSWRLTAAALQAPRLGVVNVHTSLLPRYRGPAPIQWAIRNGDPTIGVTAHWMDERIDTGNILARRGGIPLKQYIRFDELWADLTPTIAGLVADAVILPADGDGGAEQDEAKATYAGMFAPEDATIDRSRSARASHNLVRAFHFGAGIPGPFATVDGRRLRVLRTRLTPGAGVRLDCADGPLWIEQAEPAPADVTR
jgi:methionyl-tRNA formyltransferase